MGEVRPSVFIGSSAEGLRIAEAIQVNLDRACEVVPWSQGVFGLGEGGLESLVSRLDDFDFAVLVLTPDDLVLSRGEHRQSPRDNVLLELGMFIGRIGRERTLIVYDRSADIKLPSDLAGVTHASYHLHESGNVEASLGAACTTIKGRVHELGKKPPPSIRTEVDQNTHFQVIHDLLDPAAEQFMIIMFEKGISISRGHEFSPGIKYKYGTRSNAGSGNFSLRALCLKLPDAGLLQIDLRDQIALTERGREFAKWLDAKDAPAPSTQTNLWSSILW